MSKEEINHPEHYNKGGIEVIDIIEAYDLDFKLGCVIRYVLRSKYKEDFLKDLKKAEWYLKRRIERIEKGLEK